MYNFIFITFLLLMIFYNMKKLYKIEKFNFNEKIKSNSKPTLLKHIIPSDILKDFKINNLLKNLSEEKVQLLKYNSKKILHPSKYKNILFEDFFEINKYKYDNNKYQIKLSLVNKKNYSFIKYFNKLISFCKKKFKKQFTSDIKPNALRISKENWSFQNHFDCSNQILTQLVGTRKIIITYKNKKILYVLNPGDILFLPLGVWHEIPNTIGKYNVNFNLNSEENSKASELCNSKFNKLWPKQMNRCKINNCI